MKRLCFLPVLVVAAATPLPAQQGDRDSGRLVVRVADAVIGEEEFTLEVVPDGDGAAAVNLLVSASYRADGERRAVATFGRRRITVQIAAGGTEVAREYPRGDRALILHEGLLGLLAMAGRLEPGPVTLIVPSSGGRRNGSLQDLGTERLAPGGPALRHVSLSGGEADVELWFDGERRLVRVSLPGRNLVADRLAKP